MSKKMIYAEDLEKELSEWRDNILRTTNGTEEGDLMAQVIAGCTETLNGIEGVFPCGIDDTVYIVPSKVNYDVNILNKHEEYNKIYKQRVDELRVNDRGWYAITSFGAICVYPELFGETWFLTENEAKKRLMFLESISSGDY